MASAGGHQDREPGLDAMLNAIKRGLAFAFLYPEQLIELVDLFTDIFTGVEAHHDELAILRRIQGGMSRSAALPFRCCRRSLSRLPLFPFLTSSDVLARKGLPWFIETS
ncbi:MAG: hypothetical protein ABSA62_13580 [Methyloceanibacter sp.]